MKQMSQAAKVAQSTARPAHADAGSGPRGLAVAPPAYGIDSLDRGHADKASARGVETSAGAPRLRVTGFSVLAPTSPAAAPRQRGPRDKSLQPGGEEQDKILSPTFTTEHSGAAAGIPRGVGMEVDASTWVRTLARTGLGAGAGGAIGAGIGSVVPVIGTGIGAAVGGLIGGAAAGLSAEYQWTQTIDTNDPLNGAVSPYVDPHPNDDPEGAPFYYTAAEHKRFGNHFTDHPRRVPDPARAINWDAVLSITSVHVGKRVSILESLKYGFTVNTDGTVTARAPTDAATGDVNRHISTLSSEFADWTFSKGVL
ncbi:hypothetical protein RA210_U20260 [Rubrivivax sp. A210]|uniref:hypothetical protein n=1 Tax=Rubrivivax sp. A210 TaxID=2772301 RepID=UPI001917F737|nr:hypothetical protein [Rubrivivax sp. A210]CAD5372277.1 hypothetical protein RA210_U20260 [Rubrivivax sp. A210]